ncbi:MAG TPA: hypothetical protein VES60_11530 [Nakamurella sp.]|nr:hypothetical protein [Nakamurella sp.]
MGDERAAKGYLLPTTRPTARRTQRARIDLSADEAADRVFAHLSVELYPLLTTTRGWTPDHWERWTSATLVETLLRH